MSNTKTMWLCGGQFHCDKHKAGIPFYYAPIDAECAECKPNSDKNRLDYESENNETLEN